MGKPSAGLWDLTLRSLLDERPVRVHLHGIQVGLSQAQAGEGQEGPHVGAGGSQAELHRQFSHWDSGTGGTVNLFLT